MADCSETLCIVCGVVPDDELRETCGTIPPVCKDKLPIMFDDAAGRLWLEKGVLIYALSFEDIKKQVAEIAQIDLEKSTHLKFIVSRVWRMGFKEGVKLAKRSRFEELQKMN